MIDPEVTVMLKLEALSYEYGWTINEVLEQPAYYINSYLAIMEGRKTDLNKRKIKKAL